jgi:hypothetical protein
MFREMLTELTAGQDRSGKLPERSPRPREVAELVKGQPTPDFWATCPEVAMSVLVPCRTYSNERPSAETSGKLPAVSAPREIR